LIELGFSLLPKCLNLAKNWLSLNRVNTVPSSVSSIENQKTQ